MDIDFTSQLLHKNKLSGLNNRPLIKYISLKCKIQCECVKKSWDNKIICLDELKTLSWNVTILSKGLEGNRKLHKRNKI